MSKKNIIIVLVLIVGVLLYFKYGTTSKQLPVENEGNQVGIANPASVYCIDQGGRSEIRTSADGSQFGVCIFSDNSECDEWAFFRGECSKGIK
ncbi:MAG: hypothetical protein UT05_C0001G0056 [Parcubacteria group bacterium GW2011_GWF2_38_76]|nr:MAG: hypothetical protein UT05_C0001G0056 [Parcubacteria group bacterium GW2011_GWF2_38_76]HBM45967.1 DUF333 domain-containing protein [Patescibacteria group bacterium]